jgi:hypothetical protein
MRMTSKNPALTMRRRAFGRLDGSVGRPVMSTNVVESHSRRSGSDDATPTSVAQPLVGLRQPGRHARRLDEIRPDGQRHVDREPPVRREARIDRREIPHAEQQPPGAGDERNGERDLRHDHSGQQPPGALALQGGAATFVHHAHEVARPRREQRREAHDKARRDH